MENSEGKKDMEKTEKKDDDFELDLGKIAGMFRKKDSKKTQSSEPAQATHTAAQDELEPGEIKRKTDGKDELEPGEIRRDNTNDDKLEPGEIRRDKTKPGHIDSNKEESSDKDDGEIDLGKITSIFKRKSGGKARKDADDKTDDELDVGKVVSGIKGIFSGKSKKDDEGAVDLQSAVGFVTKHYITLLVLLGIVVSVGLGFSIRMESGNLGYTDGWARNSIETTISNDIANFIGQTYPNLPDRNRQQLITEELTKSRQTGTYTFKTGQFAGQTIDVAQQIELTSQQFKTFFQDETGRNYMPDIDPYYWWRYAENLIETGNIGDEVRDGVQWDTYQFAPVGRGIAPQDTFYPKSIVLFHNFAKFFGPIFGANTDLLRTLMFYPVFISALTTLLVFLITRRIAGNVAAFFAATMVGVHGALMSRTMFGHADSDAFTIFFSVLVLWLFVEAFVARKLMWKIVFAALAGLATGLYSLSWGGWWWIFDFIMMAAIGTLGLFILYEVLLKSKNLSGNLVTKTVAKLKEKTARRAVTTVGVYFIASGLFVSLFSGFQVFIVTPLTSLGFSAIKTPVVSSASPNVLRTVAELNEGSVQAAINQLGSSFFYIAILGIGLIILRAAFEAYKRERDTNKIINDIFFAAVLTLWLAATLYSVTKGIRFVLLIVPAFSIAFGVVFGLTTTYLGKWIHQEFKFNLFATRAIIFLLLFMVFPGLTFNSDVVRGSRGVVQNDIALINDAWYNSLISIRDNSEADASITSWWDFGHHFKALADRAVTFDGTTQSTPQAHWVGRFFSTDNEREAVGILRMLNCGAHTGTQELKDILGDEVEAFLLTKRIILLENDDAMDILLDEGLTDEQAERVLELTHCDPPESFVIASQDMIGKSGVWGHFGGWNYTKADIWKTTRSLSREDSIEFMQDKYEMTDDEANDLFLQMRILSDDTAADAWISPWPGISGGLQGCSRSGEIVRCNDGLNVNLTDHNAWFPTPDGNAHPISLVYATEDGLIEKKFDNNTVPQQLSVMLVPNGANFNSVVASPQLVDGMFMRMFFLRGHGLKYFKLLTRQTGFTGTDIWVWQVDWEGKQNNTLPELITVAVEPELEKTEVSHGDETTVNYIGYLANGSLFDSTITDFRNLNITNETSLDDNLSYSPFTFTVGTGSVIPGFERGLLGAELGEVNIVAVRPEDGYTQPDHPLYNQTLYFKIKVIDIK